MIQLKENEKERTYHVFIKGKLFTDSVYYDDESNLVIVEGFPDLDIGKIADAKAADFPDRFSLHFYQKPQPQHVFDYYFITRKGKKIVVSVEDGLDSGISYAWQYWEPVKLLTEIKKLAKAKGYKIKTYDSDQSLQLKFEFTTEGTMGSILNTVTTRLTQLQTQAEKSLLKTVAKQIGKRIA